MSVASGNPMDTLAAGYLVPLAFDAGPVPVRAMVTSIDAGPEVFVAEASQPWFAWKAETSGGRFSAYWYLPASGRDVIPDSGKTSGQPDAARTAWAGSAKALAGAAAAALKAAWRAIPGLTLDSFVAGPCPAPNLSGKNVLRIDFRYYVRGLPREGSAYTTVNFLPQLVTVLSAGFPAPESGTPETQVPAAAETTADGNASSMRNASAVLLRAGLEPVWRARAFRPPAFPAPRTDDGTPQAGQPAAAPPPSERLLPLYELFNLLSDNDLRLVVQNNLVVKAPGSALGGLFMYRDGEKVVPPHSFDSVRVSPCFPPAVFEDRRLAPENAALDYDDFVSRNDQALEQLFQSILKDTLTLSEAGAALIRSVYIGQIFLRKRAVLDRAVVAGQPFTELKELKERAARRAVDLSGPEALAAFVYGSSEALSYIRRWCSKRKQESILDELAAVEISLETGVADVDTLMARRESVISKARKAAENPD